MKKLLIATFLIILTPSLLFAEDVSIDELLGNDQEVSQNVDDLEQERVENIENELNISIPEYTDNPSHIITFVDPSEDNEGVELDIDESGYKEINSPYSLPSLSIGKHRLKFRFVDSIGATKLLTYDIVIIPRPPILKAPQFTGNNMLLSGSGLASSEVLLIVSVGANNYTQIANIDTEGNWNTTIELETAPNGIYTVFGYTRKNGYASNPSERAVMEYGSQGAREVESDSKNNIYFNINEITLEDIPAILTQNPDLIIVIVSALLLGALITAILFSLFRRSSRKGEEQEVAEKINGNGDNKKEKTLMELFGEEKSDSEEKKKPKEETKKEKKAKKKEEKEEEEEKQNEDEEKKERKKKEKIFTRRDFLKDFKKFDPDKESGVENREPNKKDMKDVIVTLTSNKEE
jgi:hypothetical protein